MGVPSFLVPPAQGTIDAFAFSVQASICPSDSPGVTGS
jgi:hypothetical protein